MVVHVLGSSPTPRPTAAQCATTGRISEAAEPAASGQTAATTTETPAITRSTTFGWRLVALPVRERGAILLLGARPEDVVGGPERRTQACLT
ncbi:hypothetical protein [uncultured Friedmanniella sp.]|uniref:hypothetical protein n=1 Tax=uncultured Friedmanniella sp. TaxID=335381 RepID=UPI0035C986E2